MTDTVEVEDDVQIDVDEWTAQSRCPGCGSSEDTKVAGAIRPVVWLCESCDLSWTRETFKRITGVRFR